MLHYFQKIYQNWSAAFRYKWVRISFVLTMAAYIFFFKFFRSAMAVMELRQGTQLHDLVLAHLPSVNLSVIIFSLTYFALLLFILSTLVSPKRFLRGMQAYTLLLIMRTLTIYFIPLEPPQGMILLIDPVSNFFMPASGGAGYIVKDLFFSGHISAICLFSLVSENKLLKRFFLGLAVVVASFILLQHVHYTIDILAAPLFSFIAYKIPVWVGRKKAVSLPSID